MQRCIKNRPNTPINRGVQGRGARYNLADMAALFPAFKVIFFDLGSTLIYSKDPWPPIYAQADRLLAEKLHQAGIPLETKTFFNEYDTFLDSYYSKRGTSSIEKTTFSLLNELLEQKGFMDVPASVVRKALDAMYSITQQNWFLETDAIPTLRRLQEQGYCLGMISNTSDDKNVQQLVDRYGLRPYFETIVTSAGCGFRKPDERIFRLALASFGFPPQQTVMVGDLLEADILGANQLGMYSIWITRRAEVAEEGELKIQPQAVISALDQIPDLLTEITRDPS
jgi:putative hydrolase of the HAD superfamily